MATFFIENRAISRTTGAQVPLRAAYISGTRIRSERTGEVRDFTHRDDVSWSAIVLPTCLEGCPEFGWAKDPYLLWNRLEQSESAKDASLARAWHMALPEELNPGKRRELVTDFTRMLADHYGVPVQACIHLPGRESSENYHHAHLIMPMRRLIPEGFGEYIRFGSLQRQNTGRGSAMTSRDWGARWAGLTNAALERAGCKERVDHRSRKERGVAEPPALRIPHGVFCIERVIGRESVVGSAIRARHRELVLAYAQSPEKGREVEARQRAEARVRAKERRLQRAQKVPYGALTREERRAVSRSRYVPLAQLEKTDPEKAARIRSKNRLASARRLERERQAAREGRGMSAGHQGITIPAERGRRKGRRRSMDFGREPKQKSRGREMGVGLEFEF